MRGFSGPTKNRTAADLRAIFNDLGGNLASSGSTAYLFERIGTLEVPAPASEEDRLLEVLLEAGAGDCNFQEDRFYISTPPEKLAAVAESLRAAGFEPNAAKLTYEPRTTNSVDEKTAETVQAVCEALEELDDVLEVHTNHEL